MVMTGAVYMDLLGHSVSYLLSWSENSSSLLLEGTLLAARVWVAEWGKKARGLNIAYKVLALFLLSVCSQKRNPLLPLLRIDLHFSTSWGESLESDCFLNRFSNNFPVFKPPHPPNFQIPGTANSWTIWKFHDVSWAALQLSLLPV